MSSNKSSHAIRSKHYMCKQYCKILLLTTNVVIFVPTATLSNPTPNTYTNCPLTPNISIYKNLEAGSSHFQNEDAELHSAHFQILQNRQLKDRQSYNFTSAIVSCRLSQPITWEYNALRARNPDHIIKSAGSSRTASNPWNETTFCYEAHITLEIPPTLNVTWRYTCRAVNTDEDGSIRVTPKENAGDSTQSSVYFYRNGNPNADIVPTNLSQALDEASIELDDKTDKSNELAIKFNNNSSCGNGKYPFTCESKTGVSTSGLRLKVLGCKNLIHCDLLWEASHEYLKSMIRANSSYEEFCPRNQSGVVVCSTANGTEYQYSHYFVTQEEVVLNPTEETVKIKPVVMHELTAVTGVRDHVYLNNILNVTCEALKFLFSDGLELGVLYNNGSLGSASQMVVKNASLPTDLYHRYEWDVKVTSADIASYVCLAPVIKSRKWMNRTRNITYGPRTQILRDHPLTSKPAVTFYNTDVNVTLSCYAVGAPSVQVEWLLNDNEFSLMYKTISKTNDKSMEGNLNYVHSELFIPKMIDLGADITGKWTCRASNGLMPDDSYDIDVKVTNAIFIWILIVITICAVIVVSGYFWHRFWLKYKLGKLREKFEAARDRALHGDQSKLNIVRDILGRTPVSEVYTGIRYVDESVDSGSGTPPEGRDYATLHFDDQGEDILREAALAIGIPNEKRLNAADVIIDEHTNHLGEGHYGEVFPGTYVKLGFNEEEVRMRVAIKIPKPSNRPEETQRNREALLEELTITSRVAEHVYIVKFIGAVIAQDANEPRVQAVLELCEISLEDQLQRYRRERNQRLPVQGEELPQELLSNLLRWSFQIACGMQHLASQRIIHRDLATRNVMLASNNGQLEAKITDFGLSRKLESRQYDYISQLGRRDLPWRHLAPELLVGGEIRFSQATDVWAFGITLWEIFSLGDVPFNRMNFNAAFRSSLSQGRVYDLLGRPDYADMVDPAIYRIMCRCWNAEAANRPKFTELTQRFLHLLPREYLENLPLTVYEPVDEEASYNRIRLLVSSPRNAADTKPHLPAGYTRWVDVMNVDHEY